MAWTITNPQSGMPPIGTVQTSIPSTCPLGTIVTATDSTYGGGEFIFLATNASQVVGSLVTWSITGATTTLVPSTANLAYTVGVAMDAYSAGYAWFQVSGAALIKKSATKGLPLAPIYVSATTGRVTTTAASGKQILGTRTENTTTVTTTTSTLVVTINRSFMQGRTS